MQIHADTCCVYVCTAGAMNWWNVSPFNSIYHKPFHEIQQNGLEIDTKQLKNLHSQYKEKNRVFSVRFVEKKLGKVKRKQNGKGKGKASTHRFLCILFSLMWCHLVAISFINNDYTACLVLFNNSSFMFPEYGRKEWIKNRELKSSYEQNKKQIEQKRVFLGKTTFTQWFIVLNRKKNKYPSKANEIFENKWKMKINIRINTIKTNRIEVFTILTVLRIKLFADISRK